MCWVVVAQGEKGCRDFLCQRVVNTTLGGEAAVAITRTTPEDPQALIGETPLGAQDRNGVPTNRAGVVFLGGDEVYHDSLISAVGWGTLLMKGVDHIPIRHQP